MKKTILIILLLLLSVSLAAAENVAFWIRGYKYYPLYPICQGKDIEYSWDGIGRTATLRKNGTEAKIRAGSDKLLIDGEKLEDIGPPIYCYKGTVLAPSSFLNEKLDRIFKVKPRMIKYKAVVTPQRGATPQRVVTKRPSNARVIDTIVIDPGHGGNDPGAIGRYYRTQEKKITLDIAKRLEKLLSAEGLTVYLTRRKDTFVPLSRRAEIANEKGADFFISVHANSSRSRDLRGFEVYYLSEKTDDSQRALDAANNSSMNLEEFCMDKFNKVAKIIACDLKFTENRIESRELSKHLLAAVKNDAHIRNNSLRSARYHILKNINTDMPAALVEVGYLSYRKEEELLRKSEYRETIARDLAQGILNYKEEYERTNGFTR